MVKSAGGWLTRGRRSSQNSAEVVLALRLSIANPAVKLSGRYGPKLARICAALCARQRQEMPRANYTQLGSGWGGCHGGDH